MIHDWYASNTMVSNDIYFPMHYCIGYAKESHAAQKSLFPSKPVLFLTCYPCQVSNWNFRPLSTVQARYLGGFHWKIWCLGIGFAHLNPAWNDFFAGHLCCHGCTCALAFGSCSAERTGWTWHLWSQSKECTKKAPLRSSKWVLHQVLPQRTWGVAYRARCWWWQIKLCYDVYYALGCNTHTLLSEALELAFLRTASNLRGGEQRIRQSVVNKCDFRLFERCWQGFAVSSTIFFIYPWFPFRPWA